MPGQHYYIQHPFTAPFVPGFVSVVYPNGQQPVEYPDNDNTQSNADNEPTENPDTENVVIDNADIDASREETTQGSVDESIDNDDSVSVEAYRFGGDN